jgi:hypothetical protein
MIYDAIAYIFYYFMFFIFIVIPILLLVQSGDILIRANRRKKDKK